MIIYFLVNKVNIKLLLNSLFKGSVWNIPYFYIANIILIIKGYLWNIEIYRQVKMA